MSGDGNISWFAWEKDFGSSQTFSKSLTKKTDKINKKRRKLESSSVQAGSPLILLSSTYLASCPRRNAKGRSTGRNEISGEDFIMPSSINQPIHSKARIGQLGYSCGQTKSSNLLTDFLGLWKASELVDNGINEFLLISLINFNGQNFQKWRYKGFYTPKIWPVPEKIVKNTKNIPIDSFLFPLFDPTKIFPKYWSEINQKYVSNSGNFARTVTWSYPFQVKVSRKQI